MDFYKQFFKENLGLVAILVILNIAIFAGGIWFILWMVKKFFF